jgi:hypothetical protein
MQWDQGAGGTMVPVRSRCRDGGEKSVVVTYKLKVLPEHGTPAQNVLDHLNFISLRG